MNNRKQNKQPHFAEVNLTGDEFQKSPDTHMQRTRFLKLVYPSKWKGALRNLRIKVLKSLRHLKNRIDGL